MTLSSNLKIRYKGERDCICSHGASDLLTEKFFYHADRIIEYYCRCGKPAIVNVNERLYKCAWCKDNADIVAYPTSNTAKLLRHEIQSMNGAMRLLPTRFTLEKEDIDISEKLNDMLLEALR